MPGCNSIFVLPASSCVACYLMGLVSETQLVPCASVTIGGFDIFVVIARAALAIRGRSDPLVRSQCIYHGPTNSAVNSCTTLALSQNSSNFSSFDSRHSVISISSEGTMRMKCNFAAFNVSCERVFMILRFDCVLGSDGHLEHEKRCVVQDEGIEPGSIRCVGQV